MKTTGKGKPIFGKQTIAPLTFLSHINDYALRTGTYFGVQANWEEDQISRKPENFILLGGPEYTYYPGSGTSIRTIFSDETVTDPQEKMAMVARSRSHALGAEEDVHGIINADKSIDLVGAFGFGRTRDDHSAQFKWPIQRVWGYYDAILTAYNLQHVAR